MGGRGEEGMSLLCWSLKTLFSLSQLLYYIKNVRFLNNLGHEMFFDENGDPPGRYEIINCHHDGNGEVKFKTVGSFDSREPSNLQLQLNTSSINWNNENNQVIYHFES